jgi:hypothetical protein
MSLLGVLSLAFILTPPPLSERVRDHAISGREEHILKPSEDFHTFQLSLSLSLCRMVSSTWRPAVTTRAHIGSALYLFIELGGSELLFGLFLFRLQHSKT